MQPFFGSPNSSEQLSVRPLRKGRDFPAPCYIAIPYPRLVSKSRYRLFFIAGEYRRHGAKDNRQRHELAVAGPTSEGHGFGRDRIDVASHLRGLLPFGTFAKPFGIFVYLFRCEKSKIVALAKLFIIHHSRALF
jgi:hypothetical protein